ncbi:MAG: mucoidy inhibitor MuiA family protein [Bauldia sp.]
MKHFVVAALAGFFVATAPVYAADIEVEAPIRSVVVYPQGASVTREVPFTVGAGVNVLVIGGVTTGIDPSTIRIEGVGEAGVLIRSVEAVQEKEGDEDPDRARINDLIQAARDRQAALNDQLVALDAQRSFIQNLITQGPAGFAQLLGGAGGGIDQWATAWQTIGQGLDQVLSGIRQVQQEIRDIEEEVAGYMTEIAELPVARVALEIRVEVSTEEAVTGTLQATYQVGNARWVPAYDATLTTGDATTEPAIELVRRAEITQQTGEDWTDVAMTLSTSRPTGGTEAPTLFEAILQAYDRIAYERAPMAAPVPMPAAIGAAADAVGGVRAEEAQAVADFGDFRANFIIDGPVSVTSGGGTRSVRLATDAASARMFVEATPRLSEQAFLTAAFTLDSGAPILAGRVNLFRDGSYVGAGNLAFSSAGSEVTLGFGADDLVRVAFSLEDRETGERGLLTRMSTDERLYRLTVENLHDRAIEITVYDRVPVSEDERITVEQLDTTTEPTETDVDGRRGVLGWTYEYAPGETREIDNAYLVTWPADLTIYGLE